MWAPLFTGKMVVVGLFSEGGIHTVAKDIDCFRRDFLKKEESNGALTYGKLKRILCVKLGYGCLKLPDEEFMIENHVKLYQTDGWNVQVGENEFMKRILPQLMQDMDQTKPQWEWLIFPKFKRLDGSTNSLRVFRYNHMYMDGVSGRLFIAENMFDKPETSEFILDPRKLRGPFFARYLPKYWAYCNLPLVLLCEFVASISLNGDKRAFQVSRYDGKQIFAGPDCIDAHLIRAAARGQSQSVSSVLLSALGPALYESLSEQDRIKFGKSSVSVFLPRATLPYKGSIPRNQFTEIEVLVPLQHQGPGLNLDLETTGPEWTYYFSKVAYDWIGRFLVPFVRLFASALKSTVSLNICPYLMDKGSIGGNLIDGVVPWTLLTLPMGVGVEALTYGGSVILTAQSVEECMAQEQLQKFICDFQTHLMYLAEVNNSIPINLNEV